MLLPLDLWEQSLLYTLPVTAPSPRGQGLNQSPSSITVGGSSSGGASGSGFSTSGKSGGGGLGFPALLLFVALLIAINVSKRHARGITSNTCEPFARQRPMSNSNTQSAQHSRYAWRTATACAVLICVITIPVFATVLSSAPIQLSDSGMQQGQTLGWSLALSADGHVAAGGAVAYNRASTNGTDYTGAAYVYARTGGTWGSPITLSTSGIPTSSFIGCAMAVSPNGQQVIVGAQSATSQGGVYLYNETGSSWTNTPTRTALALPTNMVGSDFGEGLAVSSDGQTLIVGTRPINGSSTGEIYAYSLSGGNWGNPVALPMTGIPSGLDTGYVLAVSANGQVVVAGGPQWNNPNGDTAEGAAFVWTQNSNGTWKNPVELAYPSTLDSTLSFFGDAVAISADGTEILAAATGANNDVGAVYVYTDANGTWSSTPVMLSTSLSGANSFGSSVALSPDGQTAFMGMPVNDTGYVFMSSQTNGTWSTPTALSLANLPVSAFLGIVLAQGDNGEELLTTGYTVNNGTGALFVYDSPAAITLAASPSAPAIAPGSSLTFNLSLTNADQPGSTAATTLNDVVLTDTLPTGTTYVSSDAANGTCSNSGPTVTCTLASLAPGNNSQNPWSPSITVKTQATAANLTNTLIVGSNESLVGSTSVTTQVTNDVVPAIKSGNVSTASGIAVSGTLDATSGFPGQVLTFSIVSQPSNGTVSLTDASTGAFTYIPNAGYNGTDSFVWTAGDGFVTAAAVSETVTVGGSGSGGSGTSGKSGGGVLSPLGLMVLLLTIVANTRRRSYRKQI